MPAINPRITITLKPEVHAVLRRLSGLTENSQSAIVSDLLESSLPVFERMAQVLEAAQVAKEAMSSEIAQGLARAQTRIETQLGLAIDDLDTAYRPILAEAERVQRRKRGATKRAAPAGELARTAAAPAAEPAGAGLTPVPVTRGSGRAKRSEGGTTKGAGRGRV